MTDTNVVKQLEVLLEPIKKDIGFVKKDLGEIRKKLREHDGRFEVIGKTLEQHTRILDQHDKNFEKINEKLEKQTESLVNIESTIKIYGDMYDINNGNTGKLEKRINVLEDKNEVVVPPELRLASF